MRSKRILLIDDNAEIQMFVSRVMRLEGAEVVVAGSGEQGLQVLRDGGGFDLIVLDLNLPQLSGWDVLRSLRNDGAGLDVPVVIFTASNDPETIGRADELGVEDVILKPISARDLVGRLSAVWD